MREHLERRTLSRDVVDRLHDFGVYLAGAKFEMRDGNEVCVDADFSTKARPLIAVLEIPPGTKIGAVRLRGPHETNLRTPSSADLVPIRIWGDRLPDISGSPLSVGCSVSVSTSGIVVTTPSDVICDVFIIHW
ncbi:hypothetical protein NKR23_g12186 [Pleurostoma richardsiae]|uniref:Uncharacterized protein n=1 Tax=Pleurostoma richardsiae TaxID=41990 RepID=A0AA38RH19_9PEZI|nr:hypothetical protein NKR23_g12186 [Pleurostoma richardsiae]